MVRVVCKFVWGSEILSVNERLASVLLAVEVADEGERVVWLIFVGRGLDARSDDDDAEYGEAYDYYSCT